MGRKPNPLILEFFQRGPKLEDQSNRYVHTCKRCGQVFPKGRPDSLTRHLFEKCPNITVQDREHALAQIAEPEFMANAYGPHDPALQHMGFDGNGLLHQGSSLQREPSALDTLAEVSRHHLDLSRHGGPANGLLAASSAHHDTNGDMDSWLTHIHQQLVESNSQAEDGSGSQDGSAHAAAQVTVDVASPLVQTASAANELQASLSHDSTPHASTREIPLAEELGAPPMQADQRTHDVHLDPQLQAGSDNAALVALLTDSQHANPGVSQPRVAHQQYASNGGGYGLLSRPSKKQGRSRFSDDRRKEVGSIRKLGACLRCRMLKKPCSGETPCTTCRTIDSARLWTNACIRTRIVDEFPLYSKKLFYSRAHQKVTLATSRKRIERLPGRIEATLFPQDKIYVTFAPIAAEDGIGVPPNAAANGKGAPTSSTLMIDFDADDMTNKVERYLVDETDKFIDREPSQFLKTTLGTATRLIQQQGDVLLARAINLWIATNVLIASNEPSWAFYYSPDVGPVDEPESAEPGPHVLASDSRDYGLIKSQLLDATERYCATQGKAVMAELERRLLARQQTAAFVTFLVSVILLNCVERMSLLYRSFDTQRRNDEDGNAVEGADFATTTQQSMPADWPLDQAPAAYWTQGQRFADLLHLLLKLRGLPPATFVRDDDTLGVLNSAKLPRYEVPSDGSHPPELDLQQILMAQWLASTSVTATELHNAKSVDDGHFSTSGAWDLRFVAPLLLPEEPAMHARENGQHDPALQHEQPVAQA